MKAPLLVVACALLAGCGGRARPPQFAGAPVILFSIDTLRADHLPAYGYAKDDSRVHFGLGDARRADVEIRWPSGTVQALRDVAVDRLLDVHENRGVVAR